MRMLPSRYLNPRPSLAKRSRASVGHVSAPLKGLSLSSKLIPGDPLTATILDNWVIVENAIVARPGTLLQYTDPAGQAIESFVPFYGNPNKLAYASAGKLVLTNGSVLHTGFLGNDWSWSSFSNLGTAAFTVMVNGIDGVWSWDGAAAVTHETVTAPATATWVAPAQFNVVISHMNRLWFADSSNLAVYYLPVQQKSGEVKVLPLNAVFRRGGHVVALATWTLDGGAGMDDHLVIFSSNGECVVYTGLDPDSDFQLVGIYRFDSPMSKHCVVNYGGELYVLISTGLVPMSTLMRAESEQLGISDRNVFSAFNAVAQSYRAFAGWSAMADPSSGRIICNLPKGGTNAYGQMVRFMPNPVWASWSKVPSRCWGWVDNRLYFGTDDGRIMQMDPSYLSDNGSAIRVDVQPAWSTFKSVAIKQFKMVLPYLQSDGVPAPYVDIRVDYDMSDPLNQPDVTLGAPGATWDVATWDVDGWAQDVTTKNNWSGVSAIGRVGAPRLVALISNCKFSLTGWDVLFEQGAALG